MMIFSIITFIVNDMLWLLVLPRFVMLFTCLFDNILNDLLWLHVSLVPRFMVLFTRLLDFMAMLQVTSVMVWPLRPQFVVFNLAHRHKYNMLIHYHLCRIFLSYRAYQYVLKLQNRYRLYLTISCLATLPKLWVRTLHYEFDYLFIVFVFSIIKSSCLPPLRTLASGRRSRSPSKPTSRSSRRQSSSSQRMVVKCSYMT